VVIIAGHSPQAGTMQNAHRLLGLPRSTQETLQTKLKDADTRLLAGARQILWSRVVERP